MDEELLKRNTDCVYFLASPFTCKKGVECEYRHNEMARMNPRDCWYWTMGGCLNPTCGFRDPPLEVHIDASVEAPSSLKNSFLSASKSGVPCYFYYSGCCNKGDRCPFLHGPDDSTVWKSKLTQEVSDAPALDTKTSRRAAVALRAGEKCPSPSAIFPQIENELQVQHKQHVQLRAENEIVEPNAFGQVSVHNFCETANTQLGSLHLPENVTTFEPNISSDESSENQVDDYQEKDEWLESSPGFDVLVDRRSEDFGYNDEQEHLQTLGRNDEDLEYHYLDFGCKDHMDYENRILLEKGINETSVYFDDLHRFDIEDCTSRNLRDRKLRKVSRTVSRKREFFMVELPV